MPGKIHHKAYKESVHFTQKASFIAPFCHKYWRNKQALSQVLSKRIVGSKLNEEPGGACEGKTAQSLGFHLKEGHGLRRQRCSFHSTSVKTLSVLINVHVSKIP